MSDFKTVYPNAAALDPGKRINYTHGLVLGVDEFRQEQLHLLHKGRSHQYTLHGYGTVSGLDVVAQADKKDGVMKVHVRPGVAIDRLGREVTVTEERCAVLDNWLGLATNSSTIGAALGGSPATLALHVVLCYRECFTDTVPIPGGPCQSVEDSSAPSRIADSFELKLQLETPAFWEELGVFALGVLFRQLKVEEAADTLDIKGLETLLQELVERLQSLKQTCSPPLVVDKREIEFLVLDLLADDSGSPPFSPPSSPPGLPMVIHPDDIHFMLRHAWRLWLTVLAPQLAGAGCQCAAAGNPDEGCILLATLNMAVEEVAGAYRVLGTPQVDQDERPFLLPTRLLQEFVGLGATGNTVDNVVTYHPNLDSGYRIFAAGQLEVVRQDSTTTNVTLIRSINVAGGSATQTSLLGSNPSRSVQFLDIKFGGSGISDIDSVVFKAGIISGESKDEMSWQVVSIASQSIRIQITRHIEINSDYRFMFEVSEFKVG